MSAKPRRVCQAGQKETRLLSFKSTPSQGRDRYSAATNPLKAAVFFYLPEAVLFILLNLGIGVNTRGAFARRDAEGSSLLLCLGQAAVAAKLENELKDATARELCSALAANETVEEKKVLLRIIDKLLAHGGKRNVPALARSKRWQWRATRCERHGHRVHRERKLHRRRSSRRRAERPVWRSISRLRCTT